MYSTYFGKMEVLFITKLYTIIYYYLLSTVLYIIFYYFRNSLTIMYAKIYLLIVTLFENLLTILVALIIMILQLIVTDDQLFKFNRQIRVFNSLEPAPFRF